MGGSSNGDAAPISVVLVDDHEMVAESLSAALSDEPDITVAGVATNIAAALELVGRTHPEVVVLDYRLPDGDGIDAGRRMRITDPNLSVVILTATANDRLISQAMAAGCTGVATKDATVHDLCRVVRSAAHGERAVAGHVEHRMALAGGRRSPRKALLTDREQEVLHALSLGQSTSTIARSLGLSEFTVRNHVRNILLKLDAHTKLEAVVQAARAGILDLDES